MSYMFWMCMNCGKHAKGTAQEISDCCMDHMCEPDLNTSRCNDCVVSELPPPPPPSPSPSLTPKSLTNESSSSEAEYV